MSYYFSKTLPATFADAIARTKEVLAAHGFGVLSEIDVASTLKAKLGVDMPHYVILGTCNPQYAHRALEIESKIGTMLPCNVIVREAGPGSIEVAAVDPVASMQAVENAALAAVADPVRGFDPAPSNASSLRVRIDWILEEDHAPEALHARGNRREAAAS